MKRCLHLQIAIGVFAFAVLLTGNESCFAGGGDSWGGGFGSRGLTGGSWGSRGGFRTPVRDFFAYRQPIRSLLSGVGSRFASRGSFGSRGWGGSSGFGSTGYGSTGYGSTGLSNNGGSSGYSYYSGGSSGFGAGNYVSSPATSVPSQSMACCGTATSFAAPAISNCPDCVTGAISYGNAVQPTIGQFGTINDPSVGGNIISTDQSIIPAEQYYDQGSGSITTPANEGSGSTRGFESPPTPEPSVDDDTTTSIRRGDAILSVNVPSEAQVYVNGRLTKTKGELRKYVSRHLKQNRQYEFNVKAILERDGKELTLQEDVSLRAGKNSFVSFDFERPVLTQLTVKVPKQATVELCGNKTKATGAVRNFKTRLEPGKVWEDYQIEISYKVDGQVVKQNRSISIEAGGSYVVDFDSEKDMYVSN